MVPDVFIDPEGAYAVEAGRVIGQLLQRGFDRCPHSVPSGAQLAGQSVDSGVLTAQLLHRPVHDAGRGGMSRRGKAGQVLDERGALAGSAGAQEPAFAPQDCHRPTE